MCLDHAPRSLVSALLDLDVTGSGGVTAANEAMHAPSGTEEHRFKIAATGTATLRGVGDDLSWAFNATPDKPPTIALTKDPEQQNRGAMLLSYRSRTTTARPKRMDGLRPFAGIAADDAVDLGGRPRRDLLDHHAILLARRDFQSDLAEEFFRRQIEAREIGFDVGRQLANAVVETGDGDRAVRLVQRRKHVGAAGHRRDFRDCGRRVLFTGRSAAANWPWIPSVLFPSRQDPGVAQVILSSIATSIMTVVSIVFAILLMTLTLASTQFSPRILIGFTRDRTTQWTLGVFLGTFSYCMATLPAARTLPHPFVPVASVTGAMLLALVCVGWLIYFINHISQSISVNHIVDRLARETELVIDDSCPIRAEHSPCSNAAKRRWRPTKPRSSVRSPATSAVNIGQLVAVAKAGGISVHVARRVGQFVPAGVPLVYVSKPERVPPERAVHIIAAFDIGPTRTMQQDIEFGIVQIGDIGLRAISPAVNDPSTAISCVDQLSRIIIHWTHRTPPPSHYYAPPHVLRLVVPWMSFDGLLDTAFEQIRHYAVADVAVSLRLMRAYSDIAGSTPHADLRASLLECARRVAAGCAGHLPTDELVKLKERLAAIEASLATAN